MKSSVKLRKTGWKPFSPLAAASTAAALQVVEGGTINKHKSPPVISGGDEDWFVVCDVVDRVVLMLVASVVDEKILFE